MTRRLTGNRFLDTLSIRMDWLSYWLDSMTKRILVIVIGLAFTVLGSTPPWYGANWIPNVTLIFIGIVLVIGAVQSRLNSTHKD